MRYLRAFNRWAFKEYFSGGKLALDEWLEKYLDTGATAPFSMADPSQYDLGDFFRDLSDGRNKTDDFSIHVENSIKTVLGRIPHNFRLPKLSALAYAAAQAQITNVSSEVALAIEGVLDRLTMRSTTEKETSSLLIPHLDKTIAAIARLAMDRPDANVLRVCRSLFANDELALFSASLFAPLALADLKDWPGLWAELERKAQLPMGLFGISPDQSGFVSWVFWSNERKVATWFDLAEWNREFFAEALRRGHRLRDILNPVATTLLRQEKPTSAALSIWHELNKGGERVLAQKHINESQTKLFVTPEFQKGIALTSKSRSMFEYVCDAGAFEDFAMHRNPAEFASGGSKTLNWWVSQPTTIGEAANIGPKTDTIDKIFAATE